MARRNLVHRKRLEWPYIPVLPVSPPIRCYGRPEQASKEPCSYARYLSLSEQGAMRVAIQDIGRHVQSFGERELRIHQVQWRAEQRRGHPSRQSEADWLCLELVGRVVRGRLTLL